MVTRFDKKKEVLGRGYKTGVGQLSAVRETGHHFSESAEAIRPVD
jgi:hypothetical protein